MDGILKMSQEFVQVDAFTGAPFSGNPAAVCVMEKAAEVEWMQAVAAEMNLSETAFLYPDGGGYNLRWFTPAVEVELCGHATLASAWVLYTDGHVEESEPIRFQTLSGQLVATREGSWIKLDFPASRIEPIELPEAIRSALGTQPSFTGRTRFDYLCEVDSEDSVRGLQPDQNGLKSAGVRGVMVTARSDGEYDFVSRFFAPGAGIDEDPVTGSAHCALGPYWKGKLGKSELIAYQASRRGGVVKLSVGDERVALMGQAVITLRGQILV